LTLIRADLLEAATQKGVLYVLRSFRELNNGDELFISVTAPASPPETIGLGFEVDSDARILFEAYRGTTLNVVPGGTILSLTNTNEASGNTSDTVVREDPTIDSLGTLESEALIGPANKNTGASGSLISVLSLAQQAGTTTVKIVSGSAKISVNFLLSVLEDL